MHLTLAIIHQGEGRHTDTLDGTTKDEYWHTLGNGADKTTEFEKEDGSEEDVFGFDDGEELADE